MLESQIGIIELIGLPGAGKSTVIGEVIESHLQALPEGVRLLSRADASHLFGPLREHSKLRLFLQGLRASVVQPGVALAAWDIAKRAADSTTAKLRRVLLFCLHYQSLMSYNVGSSGNTQPAAKREGLLVVEEGVLQMLLTLGLPVSSSPNPPSQAQLARVLRGNFISVIVLECSPEVALARLRSRASNKSRFDAWKVEEQHANLVAMSHGVEALMDSCSSLNIPCETLSATNEVADNAANFVQLIHSTVAGHAR
jgi:broad-specificity NMP kinase